MAGFVGIGAAIATIFKPHWAPISGKIFGVPRLTLQRSLRSDHCAYIHELESKKNHILIFRMISLSMFFVEVLIKTAIGVCLENLFSLTHAGPLYAVAKGLAVGGMAAIYELRYPGIVLNATMLTFGTAFSLYAAFQARLIDVRIQLEHLL